MNKTFIRAVQGFVVLLVSFGASSRGQTSHLTTLSPSNTTVIWTSIDGFRHDYLERYKPKTLCRLAKEGAFTTEEMPIFPSLTFPNHVAQETGVGVSGHGIPANDFYDEATKETYKFPQPSAMLRAEPIWVTAERQGVRTACIDWPLSQAETGPVKATFFDPAFDGEETDRERADRVLKLLRADDRGHPVRLVMSYMSGVDHAGHQVGPVSPRMADAVAKADDNVDHFVHGALDWFNATHGTNDQLYLIFSTDHGMTNVTELVSLDRLIGADLVKGIRIVISGPMATIHTDNAPPGRAEAIVTKLAGLPFLTAWKTADVPPQDHFADPSRIGQVVVMLKPHYGFSRNRLATTLPVPRNAGGMHGYDPTSTPDMQGAAVVWRLRDPIGGQNIGPMSNTQWDATVCRLLGIRPPTDANPKAIIFR